MSIPASPPTSTFVPKKKRKYRAEDPPVTSIRPTTYIYEGGDLKLKSVDGSEFRVHSVILSVASPVFADMFKIGTRDPEELVELAETTEMLDLMFGFIYPRESPTITSFDMLKKALHIADKYELEDMRRQLRRELVTPSSPVSCYKDALGAFAFAAAHGFKDEMVVSRPFAEKSSQFNTVDDLLKLSQTAPSANPWIALIGIPSVKNKVITTVLFNFHEEPMKLANCAFLCSNCADHSVMKCYAAPEWQARWAHGLYPELTRRPMSEWKPLFEFDFFSEALFRRGGSLSHTFGCTCLDRCQGGKYRKSFTDWASNVHQNLVGRLAYLENLETILS